MLYLHKSLFINHFIPCLLEVHYTGFTLNSFSVTTYTIFMKFHRNVPAMILFRIRKHGKKTKIFSKSLKIFLSETIRLRATKFDMCFISLVSIKFLKIIALGSNLTPPWGSQVLHGII